MVTLDRLKKVDRKALDEINELLYQLSERLPKCSTPLLRKILANSSVELWVIRDNGHIVGMGTLAVVLIPEGERAQIEDIVVQEKYRGRGLGRLLSEKLIARARARKIKIIALSSRADRIAANELYRRLGFSRWETNAYRLKL